MSDNRLTRELQNRQSEERVMTWKPPETLPMPDASKHPDHVHRYIRVSLMGNADPTNAPAKFREGWEPVKAADYPELMQESNPNSRYKDNIEIGGLLLCKAPKSLMKQRSDYYNAQANNQMSAVDNNFMKQNDERMPLFQEKRSSTTFGRGTK
jgi:hypothetical protein